MAFDAMILLAVLVSLIGGTRIVERTVTEAVSQREDDNEATIQAIKDRGGEVRPDPLHPNEPGLLLVGFFGEKFMDDDLKLLKGLRSVGSLLVINTKVTNAAIENVQHLSTLKTLRVGGLKSQIGDEGVRWLKGLPKLEDLNLSMTQVGDAGVAQLKGMKQLKRLNLGNTKVGDKGLAHIGELTELRELILNGTKVTDDGLLKLAKLKKLQSLLLRFTDVGDNGLMTLQKLEELQELFVSNTKVTPQGIAVLKAKRPHLQVHH